MSSKMRLTGITALLIILVRLPLLLAAQQTLTGDEAASLITLKFLIEDGVFSFYQLGTRYVGLTELFFSLPFVPLFGWTALSLKCGGLLIYEIFYLIVARMLWQHSIWVFLSVSAFFIIPTPHLYFLSTDVRGGHLLATLIGTTLVVWSFKNQKHRGVWFWVVTALLIALGHYTYRFSHIFVPLASMVVVTSKSSHRWRDGLALFTLPFIIALPINFIGHWVVTSSYENLNAFPKFTQLELINPNIWLDRLTYVSFELWPRLWTGLTGDITVVAAFIALMMAVLVILGLTCGNRYERLAALHVVITTVLIWLTPFAKFAYGLRFFTAIYPVVIFGLVRTVKRSGMRALAFLAIILAFFAINIVQDNNNRIEAKPLYSEASHFLVDSSMPCVFSDYETAYPLSVFSNFRISASSTERVRIRRYHECAMRANPSILVLPKDYVDAALFYLPANERSYGTPERLFANKYYVVLSVAWSRE